MGSTSLVLKQLAAPQSSFLQKMIRAYWAKRWIETNGSFLLPYFHHAKFQNLSHVPQTLLYRISTMQSFKIILSSRSQPKPTFAPIEREITAWRQRHSFIRLNTKVTGGGASREVKRATGVGGAPCAFCRAILHCRAWYGFFVQTRYVAVVGHDVISSTGNDIWEGKEGSFCFYKATTDYNKVPNLLGLHWVC